jgi:hypothetical protein
MPNNHKKIQYKKDFRCLNYDKNCSFFRFLPLLKEQKRNKKHLTFQEWRMSNDQQVVILAAITIQQYPFRRALNSVAY